MATPAQQNGKKAVHTTGGLQSPPPSAYLEQGVNDPRTQYTELVPELSQSVNRIRVYERMKRTDAQVRASLKACKIPVLGGQWYVEPASDDPVDMDAADFVEWNLFHMSIIWTQLMEEVLKMLDYGFMVFEKVYIQSPWRHSQPNRNTRNFVMLKKLAPRPPVTIKEFLYDANGGPAGVTHVYQDPSNPQSQPKDVDIEIEKLVIFTYDKEGGNLEGNSLLRTAYKHWYYKENLYKIDAIQKERHGIGVPHILLPPGYDEDDLDEAAALGRNIRANERAFILCPPGWEIGFAKVEGNLVQPLESAQHHDLMIARNVLVQFINVGSGSDSGSRATSATQFDLFLKSLRGLGNLVADVFNQYCIPQLVSYNFVVDRYPKLKVRRIGENRDAQAFSAMVKNLAGVNALSLDDTTENWLREELDMPKRVAAEAVRNPPLAGSVPAGRPPTGNQPKPTDQAPTEPT